MKVVPIPTIGLSNEIIIIRFDFSLYLEEKTIESASDAKVYNEITTVIPPESISVPLILHGILEQVEAQTGTNASTMKTSNQQDDIGRYLQEKLKILSTGKDNQKVRYWII